MNKVFRVVWSQATQSWVAVSELTKAHKKQSSNSLKAALGAAAVLLSINAAEATVVIGSVDNNNNIAVSDARAGGGSVAIGNATKADGGGSVSIGERAESDGNTDTVVGAYAYARGERNIAIGMNAQAGLPNNPVKQTIAIGADGARGGAARAWGDQSIAIGSNTYARGNSSIVIGNDDLDKASAVTVNYTNPEGTSSRGTIEQAYRSLTGKSLFDGGQYRDAVSGEGSVSLGVKAESDDISLAIGTTAKAKAVNAVAIGTGATANRDNAVAVGGGSTTDKAGTKEESVDIQGLHFTWAGGGRTVAGDVVSFGRDQYERQLKHVAPGAVSETSTDAINGSQLWGVLNHVTSVPVYFYGADNSADGKVEGTTNEEKFADAKTKSVIARSMVSSRLNFKGGATGDLSENNIGVSYESEDTIRFKLAKNLTGLTSTEVGGIVTNENGINMGNKKITNVADGEVSADSKEAVNGSQLHKIANIVNNNIKLGGDNASETASQNLNKADGLKFNINGEDGIETAASGDKVTVKINADTKAKIDSVGDKADKNLSNLTEAGETKIKNLVAWKATAAKTNDGENGGDIKEQEVKAGDTVTFEADKNIKITQAEGKFTFATKDDVKFNSVQLGGDNGPKLTKTDGNDLKVSGSNGTDPVKITNVANGNISADSKDAINGSQFNAVANNNIKLGGDNNSETASQNLNKDNGLKFNINGEDGIETAASGDKVTVKINAETKAKIDSVDNKADKNLSNLTEAGETKIKNLVAWKAKSKNSNTEVTADTAEDDGETIGADSALELEAGKNLSVKRTGKNFTFSLDKTLSGLTSAEFKKGDAPNEVTTKIDGDGLTVKAPGAKDITVNKDGISAGDKAVKDVNSGLTTHGDDKKGLVNLDTPAAGTTGVPDNNAATVGDLRKMGWVVSSDKTTDTDNPSTPYSEAVKNADEVKFVGTGAAKVSGKTVDGVRTITVDVEASKAAQSPIVYTTADGKKVVEKDGKFYEAKPDGTADENKEVGKDQVLASLNDGNNSTNTPVALRNLKSNLPETQNNNAAEGAASNATTFKDAPTDNNITHNAATVGDVLNAGWNLKGNGQAVDFVKPFDTVEFVNGSGTTVTVESKDGKSSTVKVDVAAANGIKVEDNKVVADTADLTVNQADSADAGKVANVDAANANKLVNAGSLANALNSLGWVATSDKEGTGAEAAGHAKSNALVKTGETVTFKAGDNLKIKQAGKDFTYSLNPQLSGLTSAEFKKGDAPNEVTTKIDGDGLTVKAPGAKDITVNKDGISAGDKAVKDVNSGLTTHGDDKKGLVNLDTPAAGTTGVPDNNAATVGDLRKMGWVVSSDKTTDTDNPSTPYSEAVKNADEVKFVGKGAAKVSGKTEGGVRTITVDVDVAKGELESVTADNGNEKKGQVKAKSGDDAKVATVKNVADMMNALGFNVQATGSIDKDKNGQNTEPALVKAGEKVEFKGGNRIKITQDGSKFTFDVTDQAVGNIDVVDANNAAGANSEGRIKAQDGDENKHASVNTVVQAVNSAFWKAKAAGNGAESNDTPDNIKAGDTVTFEAGKNLKVTHTANNFKFETAEKPNFTGIELQASGNTDSGNKISLAPTATGDLKVAKGDNNDAVKITNVAGNLKGAEKDTTAPTTEAAKPENEGSIKNNAATVGDVLNAGWNLKEKGSAKDFVTAYDTVDFIDGEGTSVSVETAGNKTSTIKYSVKAADKSVEVSNAGVKVKTDGDTLTTGDNGLKVNTGSINTTAVPTVASGDENKIATVGNVADAIKAAAWKATSAATANGENTGAKDQDVKAGDTVTFEADKNIKITQEGGKFTFSTKDNVEFATVKVGKDDATGKKAVNLTTEAAKPVTHNGNKVEDQPTTALNVSSSDGKPTQITGVGSVLSTTDVTTKPGSNKNTDGTPTKPVTEKLVDLKGDAVNKNAAATVGDLQNMGWIVSTKDGNGYTDVVKNANQVDFKGTGLATVTGETDKESGIRTITVNVDAQKTVEAAQTPVVYTDTEGNKLVKVGDDFYKVSDVENGKPKEGLAAVDKDKVIASLNSVDGNSKDKPTTLANVKSHLPKVNDADNKAFNADGTEIDGKNKTAAPITAAKAAQIANEQSNHAATVSDVLNAGWNLQGNGSAVDFVKPFDTVNFVNGKGTKAVVETGDNLTSTVKFDVDAGEITAETINGKATGKVVGPVANAADLSKAIKDAQDELVKAGDEQAKKAAQIKLDAANKAADEAGLNKVATAQNVADMINASGFTLKTSATAGGKKESGNDEVINLGKAVEMVAGKNLTVKQEEGGKVTYATKDDVQFNSVQLGGDKGSKISSTAEGNINVSGPDGKAPTKITGIAAGDISPNSTDAVNGAQIYALSRGSLPEVKNITATVTNPDGSKTTTEYKDVVVDKEGAPILKTYNVKGQKEIITNSVVEAIHNMNEQGIKFFHSNDGVERPKQEKDNDFDSSASGKFATAIGSKSSAEGEHAVAIGFNSVVRGNDSISIGTGNQVTGNNSGAFGDPSIINGNSSYSVGNNNTVATNDTFVLGNEVKHTVENSVILGTKSTATAGDGSATGTLNNIKQDGSKGTSTTAGSVGTVTTATVGNMTYGGFQGAKANGVVSVGAAGDERRIQNVAAGEISSTSTDAINGSQLHSVASGINNRMGSLDNKIDMADRNLRGGVAQAIATAGLVQAYLPGKSLLAIGGGVYRGEAGYAIGYSSISDGGNWIIKGTASGNSRGNFGASSSIGYQW